MLTTRENYANKILKSLLDKSAELHRHLCPRQVLGVRMGLSGGKALRLDVPRTDKRLFIFVETDGCGADGVSIATGSWVGRRNLRIQDYGKLAATFVDTHTHKAVRVVPRNNVRRNAFNYSPSTKSSWKAQLEGYQVMPEEELFRIEPVILIVDLEKLISKQCIRIICEKCGEEIMNNREIIFEEKVHCRACVGDSYYLPTEFPR